MLERFESVKDSFLCDTLWLICIYSYLRNIGPLSSWALSFKTLILVASFHGSFTSTYPSHNSWTWPLRRDAHLMISDDTDIRHYLKTLISIIVTYSMMSFLKSFWRIWIALFPILCSPKRGVMELTLLFCFSCPQPDHATKYIYPVLFAWNFSGLILYEKGLGYLQEISKPIPKHKNHFDVGLKKIYSKKNSSNPYG